MGTFYTISQFLFYKLKTAMKLKVKKREKYKIKDMILDKKKTQKYEVTK